MLQDTIAAILIIAVVWLIVRLAFGGTGSRTGSQNQSIGNTRNGQGTGKESAAVKAWRDARGDREKDLKKKKQEMMEAARRKYLEGGGNSKPSSLAGPSGSSSASSSHVPQSQVLSTT